jgi:hypothetical protein
LSAYARRKEKAYRKLLRKSRRLSKLLRGLIWLENTYLKTSVGWVEKTETETEDEKRAKKKANKILFWIDTMII